MSEPKKTIRYRVAYYRSDVENYTTTADNAAQAEACENDPRFIKWLGDWQETEVQD